jgi:peptidoglycan hydrolase CwlO-like protein
MTIEPHRIDAELEAFKRSMRWSAGATEDEKTLVLGNLVGFAAHLKASLPVAAPAGASLVELAVKFGNLEAEVRGLRALDASDRSIGAVNEQVGQLQREIEALTKRVEALERFLVVP